ncbi:MAG: 5-(carboxyamino)imidazole ribonucleotide mutase, partial [Bacteroidetes bacterium]
AVGNENLNKTLVDYKENLKQKIVKANDDLAKIKFEYKTN